MRALSLFGVCIAILCSLAAGVIYVEEITREHSIYELATELLQENGMPVSYLELSPPVPDSCNAAIPLYARLNTFTPPNAKQKSLLQSITEYPYSYIDKELNELTAWLHKNEQIMASARQALNLPCFRYLDSPRAPLQQNGPELKTLLLLQKGFLARFIRSIQNRDKTQAFVNLLATLRLGKHLADSTSSSLQFAYSLIIMETLPKCVDIITQADLLTTEQYTILLNELSTTTPLLKTLFHGTLGDTLIIYQIIQRSEEFNINNDIVKELPRALEQQVTISKLIARPDSTNKEQWHSFLNTLDKLSSKTSKIFVPSTLKSLMERTLTLQARLDLARIRLALHVYGLEHGTVPASLESLTPKLLSTLPTDPINQKNYKYQQVTQNDYVLKSASGVENDDTFFSTVQGATTKDTMRSRQFSANHKNGQKILPD